MMDKNLILKEFNRIKNLGFIKSNRSNNTGIGKTFEDYLGVDENNYKAPDFAGFEVKSKRTETNSYLTLFTKSPTHPPKVNTYLRDKYGEEYTTNQNLKKLHTSIFSDKYNSYRKKYNFKIENDKINKKIIIKIKDIQTKDIDNSTYWTYNELEKCLKLKLNALFFVYADTKIEKGVEYFHYKKAEIYIKPSLNKFIDLIDNGKLMIDIRIGSYKSGKNCGKPHDHGTGFRIKPSDLYSLYEEKIDIE
ncbi:MAG: MvaI/BcnI restriction endonuclease family protein [Bacteroidetes bacterium]|nr:MvaI/BcnI restriction endonuclease family protein [Bacteroidota bacterium]